MPVLVERIEHPKAVRGRLPERVVLTEIPAGAKNVAIVDNFPTGKEPISVVNCEPDNSEANIYYMKPHSYLPVYKTPTLVQILVKDENRDEFPQQRVATLSSTTGPYDLPIKRNGHLTGWLRFSLV